MIERVLEKIADQVLALDEASLSTLRAKYHTRLQHFDATKDWERAVIIYFIINSVITKNNMFNDNIKRLEESRRHGQLQRKPAPRVGKPHLTLIKK